jgi:hypothetical protein
MPDFKIQVVEQVTGALLVSVSKTTYRPGSYNPETYVETETVSHLQRTLDRSTDALQLNNIVTMLQARITARINERSNETQATAAPSQATPI